jgi:hypothetical protein
VHNIRENRVGRSYAGRMLWPEHAAIGLFVVSVVSSAGECIGQEHNKVANVVAGADINGYKWITQH